MAKKAEATLTKVRYSVGRDVIALHLGTGAVVEIPRAIITELRHVDASELRALKPDNAGMTLSLRNRDIDIYVPGLLADALALSPGAIIGKRGGTKTSESKRRAAQENGRRGGRPKKRTRAAV